MEWIVTSYEKPDLDGVSAMYAYAELLRKKGVEANYYFYGKPLEEVNIVADMFNISLQGEMQIQETQKFVIVDTNYISRLDSKLNYNNIYEIIDHHPISAQIQEYKNAKIQIELIGAVATLVAERFQNENIPLSREAAILLYYGIASNTIHFKTANTSEKDIRMAKWLQSLYPEDILEEKIEEIFRKKSVFTKSLLSIMECGTDMPYKQNVIRVGQTEVVDSKKFLEKNLTEIKEILMKIKRENALDYLGYNCIDILEGVTTIIVVDEKSKQILETILNLSFEGDILNLDYILLRKETTKKLKEYFDANENNRRIK